MLERQALTANKKVKNFAKNRLPPKKLLTDRTGLKNNNSK